MSQNKMNIDRNKSVLDKINDSRSVIGLPMIHNIWCHICKTANQHLWFECEHLFCPLCRGHHPVWNCNLLFSCQWCGSSTHTSGACNSQ